MIEQTEDLRFVDYIKMLPSAWVFEHFIKGSDSRRILSSSKIDEEVERFAEPQTLRQRFMDLESSDRLKCAIVYLMGSSGLSLDKADPFSDPLVGSFLTYIGKNNSGNLRLFGFREFEPHLRDNFVKTIIEAASVKGEPQPGPVWIWRSLNDVLVISGLGFQKILKKKRSGGLTRAASLQIKKLIDAGTQLKNESGDYIAKLVISYCIYRNILFETETDYLANVSELQSWLSEPLPLLRDEFLKFTLNYSGGWSIEMLSEILERHEGWISVSVFPEQDREEALNTLRALRFAGLIELKRKDEDAIFCKSKILGPEHPPEHREVKILPDFTAIIPQETDIENLFKFTRLGTLNTLDRVYKGKVDKGVISDSISGGVAGEEILQWLSQWQAPLNLLETVREWLREVYRLYITDRSILVSNDEKVTFQIDSYEPLRTLVEPLKANALFLIKKGEEARVREVLKNLGFDYRMPGEEQSIAGSQNMYTESISTERWTPVTQLETTQQGPPATMRGTKYGGELKSLDSNEMLHVIDYAILTGQKIVFDYEGSPYIKSGIYNMTPLSIQKGVEPMIEGEVSPTRVRKQFYLKKIRKIGVISK